MIHPFEVQDDRYNLWECTIDGFLRAHDWKSGQECSFVVPTQARLFLKLLGRYQLAGWVVRWEHQPNGTTCFFTLPEEH